MSLPIENDARKALPVWTFLAEYFPDAFLEVVKVAVAGNNQWNPGQPLHWARGKSTDQMNTAFRHMLDHGLGKPKDSDDCYHLAKAIWRLSAELQLLVEKDRGADLSSEPAARLAEAGRDVVRLQWLADNPRGAQIVVDGKTHDCVFWGISSHPRGTLREAIDAARATDSAPVTRCPECAGQNMSADGPIIHAATCSRDVPAAQGEKP